MGNQNKEQKLNEHKNIRRSCTTMCPYLWKSTQRNQHNLFGWKGIRMEQVRKDLPEQKRILNEKSDA